LASINFRVTAPPGLMTTRKSVCGAKAIGVGRQGQVNLGADRPLSEADEFFLGALHAQ